MAGLVTDFQLWARELAAKEPPMPERRIDITVTVGWLIILVLTALVFIGAWVVGTHIISWIVGA
jgi:hypothetical protein